VLGRFSNVSGSTSQIIVYNAPIAWKPLTLDTTKATLVHNAPESIGGEITGPVTTVAGTDWAWADCRTVPFPGTPDPTRVCLKAGFDPTQVYTLVYTGKDPMVLGLGLAATRDINAFFHHAMADDAGTLNPLAGAIKYVLSQGTSQSGNLIKTFLDLGFNEDELGRRVWDGANPHIAARQTPINFRFANPGGDASLYSPGSEPVVWWHTYQDKARDRAPASMLDRCHASHTCPKIFETNGAAEFWDLRMSPDMVGSEAQFDIPLVPEVRRYYMPSTSHGGGGGGFSPNLTSITFGTTGQCTLPANPNPESETIRALFVALNEWVVDGTTPPKSRYARLADHTLMVASGPTVRFPTIPGIPSPNGLVNALLDYNFGPLDYNDLTGVISIEPPIIKQHLPTVVPTVDADGNEQAGIKSVLAQAPLATYLGWNVTAGGAWKGQICAFTGGAVSYAQTRAARLAAGDPRPSIAERYGSQEGYNCAVTRAANRLQRGRYLLPADATRLIAQAAASNVLPSDPTNPVAQAVCAQDDDASDDGDGHGDDGSGGGDAGDN